MRQDAGQGVVGVGELGIHARIAAVLHDADTVDSFQRQDGSLDSLIVFLVGVLPARIPETWRVNHCKGTVADLKPVCFRVAGFRGHFILERLFNSFVVVISPALHVLNCARRLRNVCKKVEECRLALSAATKQKYLVVVFQMRLCVYEDRVDYLPRFETLGLALFLLLGVFFHSPAPRLVCDRPAID